jgi:hypothetical protein
MTEMSDYLGDYIKDLKRWEQQRRQRARRWIKQHPLEHAAAQSAKKALARSIAARQMYDGDPFGYGFGRELIEALRREPIRSRHRPVWKIEQLARADAFDAAAARLALSLVPGIGAALVDDPDHGKPTPRARQRRTTAELIEQVADLARRGIIVAAIADELDVSERRVRELRRKVEQAENRDRHPSIQAEDSAAKRVGHGLAHPAPEQHPEAPAA